jgi:2,4-dienoyl-CoA reductase-like NADH-dependent reductase (Old Yellow Enzyme family)/thioredoxin reductase
MQFKELFSPIKIRNLEVSNRFVVPPMGTNYAHEDGTVSQGLVDYWTARARGGWGLLIVEISAVDPLGRAIPYQPGLWDDRFIPGFQKLTDAVHKYGARIAVQLHHAGRQTNSQIIGNQPLAPSPISCLVCKEIPRELSTAEVYELIEKFGDAALRAREAGFDALEIHGAHGYLVAQFMSAHTNKRVDEFGGTFFNRMKFPVEIIKNIRRKVGGAFPIIFRLSAEEKVPGGRSLNESLAAARVIQEAGADAIHVSVGVYGSMQYIVAPSDISPGFLLSLAAEVKKAVSVPVIAVGRINNPFLAESAIKTGKADLLAWGRQSLTDPELPNKVAAGKLDEIAPCIACNQGCLGYLFNPEKLKATCLVNPFCGREGEMKIEPALQKKKIVIVGGGPGGLEAAWISAARGHEVVLYEREAAPGGQWRVGAIPPAKQPIAKAIAYYVYMGKKYGVNFKMETEASVEQILPENPGAVVLATGAKPLIPNIEVVNNPRVVTATDLLEGKKEAGNRVLIVGGGLVGCETADFLGERGREVTIVEMLPEIAGDVQEAVRFFLLKRLKEYSVHIKTETLVKEFLEDGVRAEKDREEVLLTGFDTVILALGATPVLELKEQLEGKVPELYVIGDAASPRKAIDAIEEGASIAIKL